MSRRGKLFAQLFGLEKKNIRFAELLNLAKYYKFAITSTGSDFILRHPALRLNVFINKPHGGRDTVRPHDVDRFREAMEELIERGIIDDPRSGSDEEK